MHSIKQVGIISRVTNEHESIMSLVLPIFFTFKNGGFCMIAVGIDVSKYKSTVAIISNTGEILLPPKVYTQLTAHCFL